MQISMVLLIFVALIAAVLMLGMVVWLIAAVFFRVELGSLAYISVAGVLVIAGLFAGALWVMRKALNWRS